MENVWQQQSDDIQYTACIDLTEGYATPEHHVPAFVEVLSFVLARISSLL
jgi:hypothetical protein